MENTNSEKHPISIFLTNFLIASLVMAVLTVVFNGWLNLTPIDPVATWLALSVFSASLSTFFRLKRRRN